MRETATSLLSREPGRAECIDGRIVHLPLFSHFPAMILNRLLRSLADHADCLGRGDVLSASMAFTVDRLSSGRESFSPCASFYDGPPPDNPMSFIHGTPQFAIEMRCENDYSPAAERAMAAKRADYFEAGTQVVWDADPEAKLIRCYRAAEPDSPSVFGPGSHANAEPAVPGWSVSVDWIMS
jgi:Putative restriction endonuclease